jgi:ABC-2 type transport system ATP-binding protein
MSQSERSTPLIALTGAAKAFALPVLRDVTADLAGSRIVGLIGNNGVGKTTLLRLLLGLLRPDHGSVRVLGSDPYDHDPSIFRRLGALVEKPGLYDELTVRENLRFSYGFYASDDRNLHDAVEQSLNDFELLDVAQHAAGKLSSGYRQRV